MTLSKLAAVALLALTLTVTSARAGTTYRVTSRDGTATKTYEVNFGGAKLFQRYTAFDPKAKQFVYLDWRRANPAPEPVATIWDHRTGETVLLYKFPGADQPLPLIPSLQDMKACPFTGDKDFKATAVRAYD